MDPPDPPVLAGFTLNWADFKLSSQTDFVAHHLEDGYIWVLPYPFFSSHLLVKKQNKTKNQEEQLVESCERG